jgi:NAD(P)-dependent dehydrogenase (short-subunit alcohol dehydrogenase family)
MDAGSLVFLSTAIGQVGAPGYGPYGMAKGGLNALVRTIAAEEAAQAIRANAVAPGPVLTPFVRGGMGRGVKDTSTEAQPTRFDADAFAKRIPMGRLGEPDDVAGPVLFLMSEAARYITGQVIHVNGGAFMRD